MNILFVASECAPFVKTGGLADVIGAVPKSLAPLGGDVRILLPAYPALAAQVAKGARVLTFDDLFGGPARVVAVQEAGLNLLLLDAPHLFDRAGNIYLDGNGNDWGDNYLRFGALSWVGAQIATGALDGWQPDVVNAHDWQAGLVPAYLRAQDGPTPPVVLTVHNIAFQGVFGADCIAALRLDPALFTQDGYEYWGKVSFLKGGLAMADKITTVSPTYARELMLPEFGAGLDGVLNARKADLTGILNGIDLDVWNPADDAALPVPYTSKTLKKKAQSRAALCTRFGIDASDDAPVFCVVSRLTEQKGLDMLLECLPVLTGAGARLAVLGTGDKRFETGFVDAARRYGGQVGTIIGYDETLSHLMQGGADAILIPSRFEPCGLTQLYGLRYGTIPVVARTGGLADTVIDANPAALSTGCATGVQFSPVTVAGLAAAILRTCDLFRDRARWADMMRRAMAHPVGWDQSARDYMALYQGLV
ncbi:glycogen synthase GlgA [Octadecabacter sp. R77987]|uniref:glycogen synthase GlgA n=1 Tax=Octadecabacter sp. R77987 TaxID=3093874 RepID=UPI00366DBA64